VKDSTLMLTISRRYAAIMRDDAHYPLVLENWSTIRGAAASFKQ